MLFVNRAYIENIMISIRDAYMDKKTFNRAKIEVIRSRQREAVIWLAKIDLSGKRANLPRKRRVKLRRIVDS